MKKLDVVLPLKNNHSSEVDFAVMSLRKNLRPDESLGHIYVISDAPRLSKRYRNVMLPEQTRITNSDSPFVDVESKTRFALQELVRTEEFILMNDDFFLVKPTRIPKAHRGYLSDMIASRHNDAYRRALLHTQEYLQLRGIERPLSYELHIPMIFNTQKRLDLSFELDPHFHSGKRLLARSIYGNLQHIGGVKMEDVKNPEGCGRSVFLSTTEQSFDGHIGAFIKDCLKEAR